MSKGSSDEVNTHAVERTVFLRRGGDPREVKLASLCLHFPICKAGTCSQVTLVPLLEGVVGALGSVILCQSLRHLRAGALCLELQAGCKEDRALCEDCLKCR